MRNNTIADLPGWCWERDFCCVIYWGGELKEYCDITEKEINCDAVGPVQTAKILSSISILPHPWMYVGVAFPT